MDYKSRSKAILAELDMVFKRLDFAALEPLIAEILAARRIVLIGVGREGLSTKAFTMRLMHLGLNAHWVWDETTPAIEAGDLLIATSGCGEIGHIHYVAEKAKQNGAKVAVLTGDPYKKTSLLADVCLFVPASVYLGTADVVASEQPMGNLFEQSLLILLDMMIMDLTQRLQQTKEAMEARHRNLE